MNRLINVTTALGDRLHFSALSGCEEISHLPRLGILRAVPGKRCQFRHAHEANNNSIVTLDNMKLSPSSSCGQSCMGKREEQHEKDEGFMPA